MKALHLVTVLGLAILGESFEGRLDPKGVRAKLMAYRDGVPEFTELDVPTTGYRKQDGREFGLVANPYREENFDAIYLSDKGSDIKNACCNAFDEEGEQLKDSGFSGSNTFYIVEWTPSYLMPDPPRTVAYLECWAQSDCWKNVV